MTYEEFFRERQQKARYGGDGKRAVCAVIVVNGDYMIAVTPYLPVFLGAGKTTTTRHILNG